VAVLLVVGLPQDAQIDAWIAELISVDPAVRAKAEASLIKEGAKALPALKLAFDSKNADLAARAKVVAAEIERLEFEKKHDATERPRRLEIVTLSQKDAPLSDAFKTLGSQVDSTFHAMAEGKQKLSIDVKDAPLRKVLDDIEDALKIRIESKHSWHKVVAGPPARKKRAYVPGATFEFNAVAFRPEGLPPGWVLETETTGTGKVFVDSVEVFTAQKAPVQIERCGRCGLRFTLLKSGEKGPFTVKLKGRIVWESHYDLPVADPAKAQDFKVGPFSVKYEWPKVSWLAAEGVPAHLVGRAGIEGKLKKQFQPKGGGGAMGVTDTPRPPRPPTAWCTCAAGPSPVQPAGTGRVMGGSHVENALRTRKPDQFDSVKVVFHKSIEEPFEAEAVVPTE
jgi:hypothetical protein